MKTILKLVAVELDGLVILLEIGTVARYVEHEREDDLVLDFKVLTDKDLEDLPIFAEFPYVEHLQRSPTSLNGRQNSIKVHDFPAYSVMKQCKDVAMPSIRASKLSEGKIRIREPVRPITQQGIISDMFGKNRVSVKFSPRQDAFLHRNLTSTALAKTTWNRSGRGANSAGSIALQTAEGGSGSMAAEPAGASDISGGVCGGVA